MERKLRYRLGLDLGSTSLGWVILHLNEANEPIALIKTGVRIFSDGRNSKDGTSLAVERRQARQMRRRRDRLLRRKARLLSALIHHGLMPTEDDERRKLAVLDPYELRRKGLDLPLHPHEFGRALFHLNQRRGFRSNRKTDRRDNESGALKQAIKGVRERLAIDGCRTVGEWLARRHAERLSVRARLRTTRMLRPDGKARIAREYDLYIDRKMVEEEFDALWDAQSRFDPTTFPEAARAELKDILFYQRPLRPVTPGRCTLIPSESRAAWALPSTQEFRIVQEVNNLRILDGLAERALTIDERDVVAAALEGGPVTFARIRRLLHLQSTTTFNLEDAKRDRLKGNETSRILGTAEHFGNAWRSFDLAFRDSIVLRLLEEQSEELLIEWLVDNTGVDETVAESVSAAALPSGYGNLSTTAIRSVLPEMRAGVVSFAEAVARAARSGAPFSHHSHISHAQQTGEVLELLPYYGEYLQRHVGFGSGKPDDPPRDALRQDRQSDGTHWPEPDQSRGQRPAPKVRASQRNRDRGRARSQAEPGSAQGIGCAPG